MDALFEKLGMIERKPELPPELLELPQLKGLIKMNTLL